MAAPPPAEARPSPRSAHAALWAIAETVTGAVFSTATYLVMTWFIPTAEFGVGMLALALGQILSSATEIVFADYVIARPGLRAAQIRVLNAANLVFALLLASGLALSATAVESAMEAPGLAGALLALTSILVCSGLSAIPLACLKRDLAFDVLARRTLVVRVLSCVFGLWLAWRGYGLWAIVGQQIALSVVNMAILLFIRRVGYAPPWRTRTLKAALAFSGGSFFPSMMSGNVNRLLIFVVGAVAGPREVAFVSMAARIVDAVTFPILGGVGQVTLPILSRARAKGHAIADTYRKAAAITSAVAMPVFIGLAVASPWFTASLLAPHWAPVATFISLLALERGLRVACAVNGPLLTVLGRPGVNFQISLVDVTVGLVLMTGLGRHGAIAAMIGWSLKALVYLPLTTFLTARISGIAGRALLASSSGPFVAALAMAAACIGGAGIIERFHPPAQPPLILAAQLLAGVLVYGAGLLLIDRPLVRFLAAQFRPESRKRD